MIDEFFAIRDRDSVLGRYSIEPDGETTLSRYGVDRVRDSGSAGPSTARFDASQLSR